MQTMKFSWEQKLPMVFQTEAAECGLACLAMIAGFHGLRVDLPALRHRFSVSLRGATLNHIIKFAAALDLTGRPLGIIYMFGSFVAAAMLMVALAVVAHGGKLACDSR